MDDVKECKKEDKMLPCDECWHSGVCKFEAQTRIFVTSINKLPSPINVLIVEVRIGCESQMEKHPVIIY
jgi:hypothetical protein